MRGIVPRVLGPNFSNVLFLKKINKKNAKMLTIVIDHRRSDRRNLVQSDGIRVKTVYRT